MRKIAILLAGILLCGFLAGEAGAARSGGTFNFCVPYGGDLLTLDAHKGQRVNDMIVALSLNSSLYSWDPENNRPKLVNLHRSFGALTETSPHWFRYSSRLATFS